MNKVVDNIDEIKLSTKVIDHLDYTLEDYKEYLDMFKLLDARNLKYFLLTQKKQEIINNQEAELQPSFLIALYQMYQKKDSIDIVMQHFKDGNITMGELKKLHRVVIKGTEDDIEANYDYRSDNNKWVGGFDINGDRIVDYIPPDYKEIKPMLEKVLYFLNNDTNNDILDNILIKPFIAHALIAYIQPFGNGNTRLSRVLQHGKIWHMTKEQLQCDLPLPALYLSKNYLQTRSQYRDLIRDVAVNNDWDKWINYNLNMVDEQLFYSKNNLQKIKRQI